MSATAQPTFSVYLLGFLRGGEGAATSLASITGLSLAASEEVLGRAPVLLEARVPKDRARRLERELRRVGADVELRSDSERAPPRRREVELELDASQPLLELEEVGPARPAGRMPSAAPMSAFAVQPRRSSEPETTEHPGFWSRLPYGLIVPVLGKGAAWLALLTVTLIWVSFMGGLGLVGLASCFGGLGALMALPFMALYLGLLAEYFTQAAQSGLHDEGGMPRPYFSMPEWTSAFFRGVPLVLLAIALFGFSGWLESQGFPAFVVVVAAFVPYFYWPMALLAMSLTGRVAALGPLTVLGAALRGGPQYLVVVVVGFMITAAAMMGLGMVIELMGVFGAIVAAVLVFAIVPYVSAAQGYLLGCMVGADSERWADFR